MLSGNRRHLSSGAGKTLRYQPDIKIKGFETVKRNICKLVRRVQSDVLELVLKSGKAEQALEYVDKVVDEVKDHRTNTDDLIISTVLSKPIEAYESKGPHVHVAIKMKEKNMSVRPGKAIPYIIKKGVGSISDRAEMPQNVHVDEYDDTYYLSHQVFPSVDKIFEIFEIDIGARFGNIGKRKSVAQAAEAKGQSKLFEF